MIRTLIRTVWDHSLPHLSIGFNTEYYDFKFFEFMSVKNTILDFLVLVER